jgi:hypothetical protein
MNIIPISDNNLTLSSIEITFSAKGPKIVPEIMIKIIAGIRIFREISGTSQIIRKKVAIIATGNCKGK